MVETIIVGLATPPHLLEPVFFFLSHEHDDISDSLQQPAHRMHCLGHLIWRMDKVKPRELATG